MNTERIIGFITKDLNRKESSKKLLPDKPIDFVENCWPKRKNNS